MAEVVTPVTDTEEGSGKKRRKSNVNRPSCAICKTPIHTPTVFLNCIICKKRCCWKCSSKIAHPHPCEYCYQRCHDECAPMCQNCNRSACAHCFGKHMVCPHLMHGCEYKGCQDCYDSKHDCIDTNVQLIPDSVD